MSNSGHFRSLLPDRQPVAIVSVSGMITVTPKASFSPILSTGPEVSTDKYACAPGCCPLCYILRPAQSGCVIHCVPSSSGRAFVRDDGQALAREILPAL